MYDRIRRVSIPIGFSNELQRGSAGRSAEGGYCVSIPIGFSNELQPLLIERQPRTLKFQSLSGFPMSCNGPDGKIYGIPRTSFQSLSGFPMSCNGSSGREPSGRPRVNPYRVFQ